MSGRVEYLFNCLSDQSDCGSPESNKQGLENTVGDQIVGQVLKGSIYALVPGVECAAEGCGLGGWAIAAFQATPIGKGANLANGPAGHAFGKHVLGVGAKLDDPLFRGLGIRTMAQLESHIVSVMANPTATRALSRGRTAYWHEATSTVVITNPRVSYGGTVFQPSAGRAYFDGLK